MERYAPPPEVVTELENCLGRYSIQLRCLVGGAGVVAVVKRADGACISLLFDVADQPHRVTALWRGLDLHALSLAPPRRMRSPEYMPLAPQTSEEARLAAQASEGERLAVLAGIVA
jgi:hypothetical protein